MTHGKTLRITLTGAFVALMAAVPVAQANQTTTDVHVCNQATANSKGGDFVATDVDGGSAAKFTTGLKAKPGNGAGLYNAATRSSALSLCSAPATTPPGDGPVVTGPGDGIIVS